MNNRLIDIDIRGDDSGEYYPEFRKGYANPAKCTGIEDFINTIQHEYIHKVLGEEFGTTAEQDHYAINIIDWADINLDGKKEL